MVFEEVRWIPARNVTLVTYWRILLCGGGSSIMQRHRVRTKLQPYQSGISQAFYLPETQHRHSYYIVLFIQVDFLIRAPSSTLNNSTNLKQH